MGRGQRNVQIAQSVARGDRRFDTCYLRQRTRQLAAEAGIDLDTWTRFEARLQELARHNERMYQHTLRVGIYAYGLACAENWEDPKLALWGGCGHDIGKADVPNEILDANGLTAQQFEMVKGHCAAGFARLKDDFLFTAFIAGLHHKLQDNGYGIDLDDAAPRPLDSRTRATIERAARLVMMVDFYDALTTRDNDKGLVADLSDTEAQRRVLAEHFPDAPQRVSHLFSAQL